MAARLKLGPNSIGMPFLYNVSQKVGYKQPNLPDDVQLVQFLLKEAMKDRPDLVPLGIPRPTGKFDAVTGFYIYLWQHFAHRPVLDGVVSPARGMNYSKNGVWVIADLNATLFTHSRQTFETIPQNQELSGSLRKSIEA